MDFIERWRLEARDSLAEFATLAPSAGDIDMTYGMICAGILWPIRELLKGQNAEAKTALVDIVAGGYRQIRMHVRTWEEDRLTAAQELSAQAEADPGMKKSL